MDVLLHVLDVNTQQLVFSYLTVEEREPFCDFVKAEILFHKTDRKELEEKVHAHKCPHEVFFWDMSNTFVGPVVLLYLGSYYFPVWGQILLSFIWMRLILELLSYQDSSGRKI